MRIRSGWKTIIDEIEAHVDDLKEFCEDDEVECIDECITEISWKLNGLQELIFEE